MVRYRYNATIADSFHYLQSLINGFGAEDDPAENGKEEGNENLQSFAPCGQEAEVLDAGSVCIGANLVGIFAVGTKENERGEKQSVVGAPSNKRPVRTMPETGQKENDKGVADDDEFLVTVRILNMGRNLRTEGYIRNRGTKW